MKKTIILVCLILASVINAQQIDLKRQKGFKNKKISILDSVNIKNPDFDVLAVELRILHIIWQPKPYNATLWQIKKDKNGRWSGFSHSFFYYNSDTYDFNNTIIKSFNFKNTWQDSWNNILYNNYLNLPNDKEALKIKCKHLGGGLPPILGIGGGETYYIEVLTKRVKRRFSFSNPKANYEFYKKEYGTDCQTTEIFKKYIEFIELLKSELENTTTD